MLATLVWSCKLDEEPELLRKYENMLFGTERLKSLTVDGDTDLVM